MAGTPHVAGTVVNAADLNDRVKIYDRATTEIDVNTTVTETTVYTKSIGAGHMSTDRMLRLTLLGDYLNNNAAANITLRVKLGATTLMDDITAVINTSATRRPFNLQVEIANLASASVQFATLLFVVGPLSGATTGIGDLANASDLGSTIMATNGTTAVATASAQTLVVTIQHNASSANQSFRRKYALLELC